MEEDYPVITTLIMNDDNKALNIEFDHDMRRLDFVCDAIGCNIRGNIICETEIINKFGSILDCFGIQDGETKTLTSNHQLIRDFIILIMEKFMEKSIQ